MFGRSTLILIPLVFYSTPIFSFRTISCRMPPVRRSARNVVLNLPSPARKIRRNREAGAFSTPSRSSSVSSTTGTPDLVSASSPTGICCNYSIPSTIRIDDVLSESGFVDMLVAPEELRPSVTLTTGQCFHWTAIHKGSLKSNGSSAWGVHNATMWIGTVRISPSSNHDGQSSILLVRERPEKVQYKVLHAPFVGWDADSYLRQYFQLNTSPSLAQLYQDWGKSCARLKRIAVNLPGVRIIDQDPWECLVSFLCSSNNNIPRITKILQAIRRTYGTPLLTVSLGENEKETFYSFPSLHELYHKATEDDLRQLCGMGYRAKYLTETMKTLVELGGERYLETLRQKDNPDEVQEALLQFCGVGRKVGDCVALFSLKQDQAIPVDVHVWNIARRDYDPAKVLERQKSLTPKIYRQVGDVFRKRFVSKSGWAHSLLFVAELPSFRPALPKDILNEMDEFRRGEELRKKEKREEKRRNKESSHSQ